MPRIRTIKPTLPSDPKLNRVSIGARLAFIHAITQADDYGALLGSWRALLGALFPLDETVTEGQLGEWVGELEREGLVRRDITTDGQPVLLIVGWEEHQKISHKGKPGLTRKLTSSSEAPPEPLRRMCGVERDRDKGEVVEDDVDDLPFPDPVAPVVVVGGVEGRASGLDRTQTTTTTGAGIPTDELGDDGTVAYLAIRFACLNEGGPREAWAFDKALLRAAAGSARANAGPGRSVQGRALPWSAIGEALVAWSAKPSQPGRPRPLFPPEHDLLHFAALHLRDVNGGHDDAAATTPADPAELTIDGFTFTTAFAASLYRQSKASGLTTTIE